MPIRDDELQALLSGAPAPARVANTLPELDMLMLLSPSALREVQAMTPALRDVLSPPVPENLSQPSYNWPPQMPPVVEPVPDGTYLAADPVADLPDDLQGLWATPDADLAPPVFDGADPDLEALLNPDNYEGQAAALLSIQARFQSGRGIDAGDISFDSDFESPMRGEPNPRVRFQVGRQDPPRMAAPVAGYYERQDGAVVSSMRNGHWEVSRPMTPARSPRTQIDRPAPQEARAVAPRTAAPVAPAPSRTVYDHLLD